MFRAEDLILLREQRPALFKSYAMPPVKGVKKDSPMPHQKMAWESYAFHLESRPFGDEHVHGAKGDGDAEFRADNVREERVFDGVVVGLVAAKGNFRA